MRTDGIYGFYPIVDSYDWLVRLLPLGVKTIQLRIKDKNDDDVRDQLHDAISLARTYKCQLVINDYWRLALDLGAEFIHLGQEDLDDADKEIILNSGIKLGISTHTNRELDRALSWPHDHVALGPVYETTLKQMRYSPQGLERIGVWKKRVDCPLIAIGGISLERAPKVLAAGADAIAVVTDVVFNPKPEARVEQWIKLFENSN